MKLAPRSCAAYIEPHVVAYLSQAFPAHPAGWFHPPVSASSRRQASRRPWLAARDQARRLPYPRLQGRKPSDPLEPPRHEFHRQIAEGRRGGLQFGCRQRLPIVTALTHLCKHILHLDFGACSYRGSPGRPGRRAMAAAAILAPWRQRRSARANAYALDSPQCGAQARSSNDRRRRLRRQPRPHGRDRGTTPESA
jgi:hypothetical protein